MSGTIDVAAILRSDRLSGYRDAAISIPLPPGSAVYAWKQGGESQT
ncbi:hypothetical protein [Allocoleopsis sp.]